MKCQKKHEKQLIEGLATAPSLDVTRINIGVMMTNIETSRTELAEWEKRFAEGKVNRAGKHCPLRPAPLQ